MRIGFTGTRNFTPSDEIEQFMRTYTRGGLDFTTGAARGFDAWAARWLINEYPGAAHRLVVPANRGEVDGALLQQFMAWSIPGRLIMEFMPSESSYRDRNARIVHHGSSCLVVIAEFPEHDGRSTRSGTWQTARLGRKANIPVMEMVINSA